MTDSASSAANALCAGDPLDLASLARVSLPERGIYAWWVEDGALPGVPTTPHPVATSFGLIYVGIGPRSAASGETLSTRLVGKHMKGNTGSSTLRLTLAAHLLDALDLKPVATTTKTVLTPRDNGRLSSWMGEHLGVTWIAHPSPWGSRGRWCEFLRPR
ncbi:MAG: GIY-YIG nuclease family protein [Actinomycetota bacterium]